MLRRIDREIGIAHLRLSAVRRAHPAGAWLGGEQLIVEPIRALARTATRIGHGDLDARLDRALASIDSLSRLANRRSFDARFEAEW